MKRILVAVVAFASLIPLVIGATHVPTCPLTKTEFSRVPYSVAAEPVSILFIRSFRDTAAVRTDFRKQLASAVSVDPSRICIADVNVVSDDQSDRVAATILVLPDFMNTGDGLTSILRSSIFLQASSAFPSSALAETVVGRNIDPLRTTNPGTGVPMVACAATQSLEHTEFSCPSAPPPPDEETGEETDPHHDWQNQALSALAWGLGAICIVVTALITLCFGVGFTRYEREAGRKQAVNIQEYIASLAAAEDADEPDEEAAVDADGAEGEAGAEFGGPNDYGYLQKGQVFDVDADVDCEGEYAGNVSPALSEGDGDNDAAAAAGAAGAGAAGAAGAAAAGANSGDDDDGVAALAAADDDAAANSAVAPSTGPAPHLERAKPSTTTTASGVLAPVPVVAAAAAASPSALTPSLTVSSNAMTPDATTPPPMSAEEHAELASPKGASSNPPRSVATPPYAAAGTGAAGKGRSLSPPAPPRSAADAAAAEDAPGAVSSSLGARKPKQVSARAATNDDDDDDENFV